MAAIDVRPASDADVDDVLSILDEAAMWLHGRGIRQWPQRFPAALVAPAVDRGETWLAIRDCRAVATVTVTTSDPLWDDDGAALYVHRLAVRRQAAGVGAAVLSWVGQHAAGLGRHIVRLDCVAHNEALRAYYEQYGFAYRGDMEVRGAPGERASRGSVTLVSKYELPARAYGDGRPPAALPPPVST